MLYTLQLFGIFEDKIGKQKLHVELERPVSVKTLKNILHENYPVFEQVQHYMLAVNEQYCDTDDQLLNPSDEIALIPPIAGG